MIILQACCCASTIQSHCSTVQELSRVKNQLDCDERKVSEEKFGSACDQEEEFAQMCLFDCDRESEIANLETSAAEMETR